MLVNPGRWDISNFIGPKDGPVPTHSEKPLVGTRGFFSYSIYYVWDPYTTPFLSQFSSCANFVTSWPKPFTHARNFDAHTAYRLRASTA